MLKIFDTSILYPLFYLYCSQRKEIKGKRSKRIGARVSTKGVGVGATGAVVMRCEWAGAECQEAKRAHLGVRFTRLITHPCKNANSI